MKKKILISIMMIASVFALTGCTKVEKDKNEDAVKFKEDYESINGKTNAAGKEYRTVSISEENPFVYATADEIVAKIANGETFYVYFGDKQCPWCRSVIEKAIEVANKYEIKKIYYVNIWDDDHNEILRDTYTADEKGTLTKTNEGTKSYYALLVYLQDVLSDYNVSYTTKKGKTESVSTGEKRIYAPSFIYIEDGEAKTLVEGISESQTDSREELTDEMLKDEEEQFKSLFNR